MLKLLLTFAVPSWLVYALAALAVAGAIYAKGAIDQAHKDEITLLEVQLEQVKADLAANEVIRRQAEADARAAEEQERKLKELLDALQHKKSCPLTRDHVDGLRRIDESP